jgi:hypothetical protein
MVAARRDFNEVEKMFQRTESKRVVLDGRT